MRATRGEGGGAGRESKRGREGKRKGEGGYQNYGPPMFTPDNDGCGC